MSAAKQGIKPVLRHSTERCATISTSRCAFSTSRTNEAAVEQHTTTPSSRLLDPQLVHTAKLERKLLRAHSKTPIGSRRRRAALQSGSQIPFEQLPYQCFQEARKILASDRQEKVKQIETQRARLQRLQVAGVEPQDERVKERRLKSMTAHLDELKIWADINDPVVKMRFENGQGDMNKPIYRFLADKQWRAYKRKVVLQRITQMNVVPDVLPTLDPTVSVDLKFGGRAVQPGEFVDSRVSELAAQVNVQVYDKGERLVTIAVVNPDVPNVEKDGFDYRCHFLASNIKISPTEGGVSLYRLSDEAQVILPWLPAYVQKGAPYNRMSVLVLQQQQGQTLDTASIKERTKRDGFLLRSFVDRHGLKPIGANMYRSQWDDGTAGVMQRAGVPGHDVEFKRMKIEPLPYKKLPGSRYR